MKKKCAGASKSRRPVICSHPRGSALVTHQFVAFFFLFFSFFLFFFFISLLFFPFFLVSYCSFFFLNSTRWHDVRTTWKTTGGNNLKKNEIQVKSKLVCDYFFLFFF